MQRRSRTRLSFSAAVFALALAVGACQEPFELCEPLLDPECGGPPAVVFTHRINLQVLAESGDSILGAEVKMSGQVGGIWQDLWIDTTDVTGRVSVTVNTGNGESVPPLPILFTVKPPIKDNLAGAVHQDTIVAEPRHVQRAISIVLPPASP